MGISTPPEAPSGRGRSARLYVRAATATPGPRESAIARLETLASEGSILAFDVELWPSAVSIDVAEAFDGAGVLATYRSFEEWARNRGVSISPPFAEQVHRSTITRTTGEQLVTPEVCLAVFDFGELVAVYPHSDDESVRTVREGLDALAAGRLRPSDGPPADREPALVIRDPPA